MRVLFTLFLLFTLLTAYSQSVLTVDSITGQNDLIEYAYHYTDTIGELNVDDFDKVYWHRYNEIPSFISSGYTHWMRYTIHNSYDVEIQKVLFIPYHHIQKIDVYLVTDSTVLAYEKVGVMRSFNKKEMRIIGYPFLISLHPHATYNIYVRYEQKYRPLRATSYLISKEREVQISYNSNSLLWFWRGIYAFALVISILMFWFLRIKTFFYYFMFNLGISLFMFAHIGDYFIFFNIDSTDISSSIDYTGAFFINMFLPLFLNGLTPIKANNVKVWKIMFFFIYGMIPFIIASYFPFIRQSDFTFIIHNYIMLVSGIVFMLQVYFLIKNIYHKERNAIYLSIIYAIYVSSAFADIILPNMGLIKDGPFVYRNLLIGSFIEVFSFMFMMAMETLSVYRHRSQLVEGQKAHQQEIIYTMVNSQEAERNRTGRELHDLIGANMAIIKQRISNEDSELSNIVSKTLTAVRSLSHGLVTPMVNDDEFIDEMKQMAYLCSNDKMQVHTYFYKWPVINNKKKTTHLYRIGQELLQNASKHSNASNVYFQFIGQDENRIGIYYEDDGVGFDYQKIKLGLGLKNIINRVELLKGEIIIESKENGSGTIVNIEIDII